VNVLVLSESLNINTESASELLDVLLKGTDKIAQKLNHFCMASLKF